MYEETHGRWATIGGRDAWTEDSPDKSESLWVRDNEKSQTRDDGGYELLLLLRTIATTATVFKETHIFFTMGWQKKLT